MISDRALNRTLLRRQFLLDRVDRPALAVVEHLVGLQAQEPADPYVALWARISGFDPAELAAAVASGDAVRIALQRSTIHLVSAADCAALRPVLQPALERMARSSFGTRLDGVDPAELAAAASTLIAEQPRTFGEWAGCCTALAGAAGDRAGPDRPGAGADGAAAAARSLGPQRAGAARAGRGPARPSVRRRSGAGPAGPALPGRVRPGGADVQNWSGLTRLAEVVDRLRPGLRTDRAEDGRGLLDLPDAPRAGPDVPAPVRFLPQYDNVLLGHADRGRIVPAGAAALFDEEFHWSPALVDGLLRASWRLDRKAGVLHVRAAGLSRAEQTAVAEEGLALLGLLAPAAADPDVVLSAG